MNTLAVCLTIGIVAGFGLLLYGVFFQKSDERPSKGTDDGNETLEKLRTSVEEADNTLSNINSVSSLIVEEIDIKYKELLFLYQMLEEKKKELLEQTSAQDTGFEAEYNEPHFGPGDGLGEAGEYESRAYETNLEILEISRKMDEVRRFPKLHNKTEILELYSKGLDVTEIAKELGIGKGEVKLVLGLNKVGAGYDY